MVDAVVEAVSLIYVIAGSVFLIGLLLAVVSTGARVIWYMRHDEPRPRLLTRDVLVKGGLCISFGLIAGVRFLPPDQRSLITTGNVAWALLTSVPAAFAMVVYLYYEIAVIKRDGTS